MTSRPWTESDLAFLRANPSLPLPQAAAALGRTVASVQTRRSKLRRAGEDIQRLHKSDGQPQAVGRRTLVAKTCATCGMLLDGTWYGRKPDGRPEHHCRSCRSAKSQSESAQERKRQWQARAQDLTQQAADRDMYEWTDHDYAVLCRDDMSLTEMALELRRSFQAVADARYRFGFSRQTPALGEPVQSWIVRT